MDERLTSVATFNWTVLYLGWTLNISNTFGKNKFKGFLTLKNFFLKDFLKETQEETEGRRIFYTQPSNLLRNRNKFPRLYASNNPNSYATCEQSYQLRNFWSIILVIPLVNKHTSYATCKQSYQLHYFWIIMLVTPLVNNHQLRHLWTSILVTSLVYNHTSYTTCEQSC